VKYTCVKSTGFSRTLKGASVMQATQKSKCLLKKQALGDRELPN
jgi:hypothetical protein